MGVDIKIKPGAPKRLVLATALATLLGGGLALPLPAAAGAVEGLLNKLRDKGILKQDEYDEMLKEVRNEQKVDATGKKAEEKAEADGEKTTVSGTAFIDFTNIDQKTNGARVAPSGVSVDVKRFYIGIDHKFDDTWAANVTTDFNYISADGETQVFLKKAYLQGKIFGDALWVRAGSADMPWIPYAESLYGYRYVENTLIDRLKFGNSADWGIHAGGSVSGNMVGYALSAVNGNGYKNPSRAKSLDFEGRVSFMPIEGLSLAGGFYSGDRGAAQNVPTFHTAQRWDATIAYVNPKSFRLGAEYFNADDYTAVTTVPSDSADGYSLWGSVNVTDKVGIFGRYDSAKPNKDTNPNLKDDYYNVGVSYNLRKNIDVSFVYKHESVDGGVYTASNGAIGSAAAGTSKSGRYDEVGLFAQVKY